MTTSESLLFLIKSWEFLGREPVHPLSQHAKTLAKQLVESSYEGSLSQTGDYGSLSWPDDSMLFIDFDDSEVEDYPLFWLEELLKEENNES